VKATDREPLDGVIVVIVGALGTVTITTADVGATAVRSVDAEVFTEKLLATYVAAAGFVIPATVNVAAVFFASEHVPPLFAKVITTLWPVAAPVAEQLAKPTGKAIVGVDGMMKPAANTAVTVLPAASTEDALLLVLNPTVHVSTVPATRLGAENVTADTAALAC